MLVYQRVSNPSNFYKVREFRWIEVQVSVILPARREDISVEVLHAACPVARWWHCWKTGLWCRTAIHVFLTTWQTFLRWFPLAHAKLVKCTSKSHGSLKDLAAPFWPLCRILQLCNTNGQLGQVVRLVTAKPGSPSRPPASVSSYASEVPGPTLCTPPMSFLS